MRKGFKKSTTTCLAVFLSAVLAVTPTLAYATPDSSASDVLVDESAYVVEPSDQKAASIDEFVSDEFPSPYGRAADPYTAVPAADAQSAAGFFHYMATTGDPAHAAAWQVAYVILKDPDNLSGSLDDIHLNGAGRAIASSTRLGQAGDASTFENLYAAMDMIDKGNALRTSQGHSFKGGENGKVSTPAAALKVSPVLMAISIVQGNASSSYIGHTMEYYAAENLAWGYSDPFRGWYSEEKALYDKGVRGNSVGHYVNLMLQDYNVTGFAVNTRSGANRYGKTCEQSFMMGTSDSYFGYGALTTAQFRTYLNTYRAGVVTKLASSGKASAYQMGGANRYETMRLIVKQTFPNGSANAVLVSGENFPDALAASSLAGSLNAPIITTSSQRTAAQAKSLVKSLGVKNLYVVGGPAAVSNAVAKDIAGSAKVTRVAGNSRQETAQKVASTVASRQGSQRSTIAIVASGMSFPDALSSSSYSYAAKAPIYLTGKAGTLDASTLSNMVSNGIKRVIIVGGTVPVKSSVESQLKAKGITTTRIAGANRYDTSKRFSDWAVGTAKVLTRDHAAVATGENFPDALAGGALAGSAKGVMLLASAKNSSSAAAALSSAKGRAGNVYFLGGDAVVPSSARNPILAARG